MNRRRSFLSLLLVSAAMLLPEGSASAFEDPGWYSEKPATEQQALMNALYTGSPQSAVPYGGTPNVEAQSFLDNLYAESPSTPEERSLFGDLSKEFNSALIVTGLVQSPPKVITHIPGVSPVTAGGLAFGAGLLIVRLPGLG